MEPKRGTVLLAAGVLLFAVSMTVILPAVSPSRISAPRGAEYLEIVTAGSISAVAAPSLSVSPAAGENGSTATVVGVQGGGYRWHEHGAVYRLDDGEESWRVDAADSYFDLTPNGDGTYTVAFMDGDREDCGLYDPPCSRTGFQTVDPTADPMVTDEHSFPVRTRTNSEVHAAERLDSGGYVLSDMEHERIVVLDRSGEVTWQWNASELYHPPPDPTRTDWLHVNDVDVVGEGRYLVSVRNANQLVIVEVVNADRDDSDDDACANHLTSVGGADNRCGDPTVLNEQHNPHWLGNGTVLVADSHNDRIVQLSRGEDGTWRPTWTLEWAGGVRLDWPRDADLLPNGNVLVTDTLNRRVVEVDPRTGRAVWSRSTEYIPYEADRLPYGEPAADRGASGLGNGTVVGPAADSSVPLLSPLLAGVRALWPGLPLWYNELQLLSTLVSLSLTVTGAVLLRRE